MMKLLPFRVYILLIIAQVCYCEANQNTTAIDPELTAQIDNFITEHYLPIAGITGLGISIIRLNDSEQAVYSKGYGMADQEKGIPNGNQTQFLIASITKSFVSAVVVKILNEKFPEMGEAVLDTPIRTLVPSANFTLIDRFRSEHGTFRDLLAHRTCIVPNNLPLVADPFNTASELLYRERYVPESCSFRSKFLYNNEMFVMAGELIGILAEKPFETLLEDLLKEIGMPNSAVAKKSDDYSNMPFRARPYYIMDNVSHPINTTLLDREFNNIAAGGIWSTPDDMAKYLSFHLNLGKIGDKLVIPEVAMKWLRTPSNLLPYNTFKSSGNPLLQDKIINLMSYGLGLMRGSYDGWEYLQHGGYFNAFSSLLSLFPSQKIGIFTTSNQSPSALNQYILHAYIFEIFRGSPNALEECSKIIEQDSERREQRLVALAQYEKKQAELIEKFLGQAEVGTCQQGVYNLPNITGKYGSGLLGELEIFEKFNPETNCTILYFSYGKWAHGRLQTYSSSDNDTAEVINFQIKWDTDIIQDGYAQGSTGPSHNYGRVYNGTFEWLVPGNEKMVVASTFRLGVSLENLPAIPWNEDSC